MNDTSKYVRMNFEELLEKYQTLLAENKNLKEEPKSLKERFGISYNQTVPEHSMDVSPSDSDYLVEDSLPPNPSCENEDRISLLNINNFSDPQDKIELFMTLFKGRDDVFAKRWENKKKGTSGYSPVCLNEWKAGLCRKPAESCGRCPNKAYAALDEAIIDDHLQGRDVFLPVYTNDIVNAVKEIVIVSPFITKRRTLQMLEYLQVAVENKVTVTIVTRPVEDFEAKNRSALIDVLNLVEGIGINLIFKTKIHQKFAIMDQKTVWYGSINLLSFGSTEESIMRLDSSNIANELIKSIDK